LSSLITFGVTQINPDDPLYTELLKHFEDVSERPKCMTALSISWVEPQTFSVRKWDNLRRALTPYLENQLCKFTGGPARFDAFFKQRGARMILTGTQRAHLFAHLLFPFMKGVYMDSPKTVEERIVAVGKDRNLAIVYTACVDHDRFLIRSKLLWMRFNRLLDTGNVMLFDRKTLFESIRSMEREMSGDDIHEAVGS